MLIVNIFFLRKKWFGIALERNLIYYNNGLKLNRVKLLIMSQGVFLIFFISLSETLNPLKVFLIGAKMVFEN